MIFRKNLPLIEFLEKNDLNDPERKIDHMEKSIIDRKKKIDPQSSEKLIEIKNWSSII